MSTTDQRRVIEDAVSPHWRGGGQARLIVDVLHRENVTPEVARIVGAKLAEDVARQGGLRFVTERVIEEKIELAEAAASAGTTPVERGFDSARCNFDSQPCREHGEWERGTLGHWSRGEYIETPLPPIVHGPIVSDR